MLWAAVTHNQLGAAKACRGLRLQLLPSICVKPKLNTFEQIGQTSESNSSLNLLKGLFSVTFGMSNYQIHLMKAQTWGRVSLPFSSTKHMRLNVSISHPVPLKLTSVFAWTGSAAFAYSATAVQYRQRKVKKVWMAKVTLVWNSDHLACHLTCTFMFAPCPVNPYCSSTPSSLNEQKWISR